MRRFVALLLCGLLLTTGAAAYMQETRSIGEDMLCTHNPVMGVPICVFLFAIAIVATIWKAISLMITRQRNLGLPSYAKPFSCFLLGVVNIVFSFYFLLRCVTHNWNWGYEMSLEHELRSSDFGFAGLLWFVSMLLILTAIRMVARSKS